MYGEYSDDDPIYGADKKRPERYIELNGLSETSLCLTLGSRTKKILEWLIDNNIKPRGCGIVTKIINEAEWGYTDATSRITTISKAIKACDNINSHYDEVVLIDLEADDDILFVLRWMG